MFAGFQIPMLNYIRKTLQSAVQCFSRFCGFIRNHLFKIITVVFKFYLVSDAQFYNIGIERFIDKVNSAGIQQFTFRIGICRNKNNRNFIKRFVFKQNLE
jgi:hypothetical protein